jgi:CRISPR/Cas system Type II protein with McrA/HNH and RuvC-like nuclease domain
MKQIFRRATAIVLLLLFQQLLFAQINLERYKITNDISIKIPTSFISMTEREIISKYVSYRQPIGMFTSEDRQVDLGINKNSTPWAGNDLDILKDFYKANIQNLFTEVKFLKEEIREISGREYVLFEFISKVSDEDKTFGGLSGPVGKYTYIMYTLYEENVLLFNFTCDIQARAQWQSTAGEIMESVRIK